MLKKNFYCGTQWAPLSEEEQEMVRERNFPGSDADNGKENINYDLENAIRLIEAGVPHFLSTDAGTIDPDVEKDWGPEGMGGMGGWSALILNRPVSN